jgi:hypothetical protein
MTPCTSSMAMFTDVLRIWMDTSLIHIRNGTRLSLLHIHQELMQQTEISYRTFLSNLNVGPAKTFSGHPSPKKSHLRPGLGIEILNVVSTISMLQRVRAAGLQYDTSHHVPCSAIRRHGICSAPGRETPAVFYCNTGDVLRSQRAAWFWLEKAEWPQCHLGSLKWKQTSSFVKQTSAAYYAYAFHNWSLHSPKLVPWPRKFGSIIHSPICVHSVLLN